MPSTMMKQQKSRRRSARQKPVPMVTFVPSNRKITMTFAQAHSITESAAASGVAYFYRLNSPYDPDASGVGAVATGYNTWAGLFLNYKVNRVTVRVQGLASGISAIGFLNVTIAPVPGQAVVPANKNTWKSIPGAVATPLALGSSGGKNVFSVTRTYDIAKYLGVSRRQYDSDMDFSGAVGSNPSRQLYLMVAADSVFSATVGTLAYQIQISMEVEWFNPTPLQ